MAYARAGGLAVALESTASAAKLQGDSVAARACESVARFGSFSIEEDTSPSGKRDIRPDDMASDCFTALRAFHSQCEPLSTGIYRKMSDEDREAIAALTRGISERPIPSGFLGKIRHDWRTLYPIVKYHMENQDKPGRKHQLDFSKPHNLGIKYAWDFETLALLGYVAPRAAGGIPVLLTFGNRSGANLDWKTNRVTLDGIRHEDARIVADADVRVAESLIARCSEAISLGRDARPKPAPASDKPLGQKESPPHRGPGRPSRRSAILEAYEAIEKDFSASMESHFAAICRKAKELSGDPRDDGLGKDVIRKTIRDRWIADKTAQEKL